jgi:hypothetical protein
MQVPEQSAHTAQALPGARRKQGLFDRHCRLWTRQLIVIAAILALQLSALGCTPTVAIKAPKKPIVINMNIKVKHEIRMDVDRDLEAIMEEEKELF